MAKIYLYAVIFVYIWGLKTNACTIFNSSHVPVGHVDDYGSVYKGREFVGKVNYYGSIFRNRELIGRVTNGSVFKDEEYVGNVKWGKIFINREFVGYGSKCDEHKLGAALLLLLLEE